ncbi:MAG: hypothetical protein D5S01_02645 [Halanaerobium sp. MSAO_Bac5]|nr:MAG: hypothetical protein D5S01_02645 [Halanaerobium sp. MSAO_Bac5]
MIIVPYLKVQTNQEVVSKEAFLKKLSKESAEALSKAENYIMLNLEAEKEMFFAGTLEPCVFMEVKSIGLEESMTAALSEFLCNFMEKELNVKQNRIYIEFNDAPGKMWGWNGSTF